METCWEREESMRICRETTARSYQAHTHTGAQHTFAFAANIPLNRLKKGKGNDLPQALERMQTWQPIPPAGFVFFTITLK